MRISIGERIRTLREENELKQCDLAQKLRISKNTLSQYETGKRTPDLEILDQIAREFKVSLDYLCGVHNFKYNPRSKSFNSLMMGLGNGSSEEIKKFLAFYKSNRRGQK